MVSFPAPSKPSQVKLLVKVSSVLIARVRLRTELELASLTFPVTKVSLAFRVRAAMLPVPPIISKPFFMFNAPIRESAVVCRKNAIHDFPLLEDASTVKEPPTLNS